MPSSDPVPYDVLRRGADAHTAGRLDEAARCYAAVLAGEPANATALHLLGVAEARRGRPGPGLTLVLRALRLDSTVPGIRINLPTVLQLAAGQAREHRDAGALVEAERLYAAVCRADPGDPDLASAWADTLRDLGRAAAAAAVYRDTLDNYPTHDPSLSGLARARMPGEDCYAVLSRLHAWLKPAAYLEIGVFQGESLGLAAPGTRALGVDPRPMVPTAVLPNGARVLPMTSDAFFASRDVTADLDGRPLDLAFIDGLHTFDQVLVDFMNVERHAHRRTVVVLHDVVPMNAASASRKGRTAFWTGDVWKAVVLLRRHRPDLALFTAAVFPTGLCFVTNLDPSSRVLQRRFADVLDEGHRMRFDELSKDGDEALAVCDNDWDAITTRIERSLE
jgi:tetratricopeptide (TPR) repeat protein